jgi:hypothetical protein
MANKASTTALGAALGLVTLIGAATAGRADPLPALPVIGATELIVADERTGLAVRGFDAVSYFLGAPRAGEEGIELLWGGVVWRFANEANREAFRRNPQVYAARLGGYDPTAAAEGALVAANPALFLVRRDRLYLFRSEANRSRFLAEPAIEQKAEARWPELSRGLVRP